MNKRLARPGRRRQRGVIATETAFLIPVVLVGIMMFMELARVALTVSIGSTAMNAAIQSLRTEAVLDVGTVQSLVVERMADRKYSYGYLDPGDIGVSVEHFESLEALGGNLVETGQSSGEATGDDVITLAQSRPVWSITVDVRKPYITPLPVLLGLDDAFRYRFKQVMGHLDDQDAESGA